MADDSDRPGASSGPVTPPTTAPSGDDGARRADKTPPTPRTSPAGKPAPAHAREAKRSSVSRAAWTALVVGIIVLILLLVFILQNNTATEFHFLNATFTMPLGVAMLFAAIAGALIMALVGTTRMISLSRTVRRLENQRAKAR